MSDDPITPPSPTDDALAAAARGGDLVAFNLLVERYQVVVFRLCLRMLSSREGAEDAAQESLLSAWRGLRGYRGGSFKSWLLRIAGNQCRDELRRRKRRPTDSLDALVERAGEWVAGSAPGRSPEQEALGAETVRVIQAGLNTLPQDQRLAVILADVQGLAYDEIAATTGSAVGTVKSRISRGRARLRTFLLAQGELPGGRRRLSDREMEERAPSSFAPQADS